MDLYLNMNSIEIYSNFSEQWEYMAKVGANFKAFIRPRSFQNQLEVVGKV